MKITLQKLVLLNFKGIRDLTIDFGDITNIYGDNAAGKTTVFDAFTWLLFGKDSTDRKDFEVKTLDKHSRIIEKIDHEVTGHFLIDNREVIIKRGLREKWEKRRGGTELINNGNEQYFFWNEVPMQAGQFQTKINDLIPETIFKLITNPFYFNQLKWQDRRNTLLSIAGTLPNNDIIIRIANTSNEAQVKALIDALNANKSIDEYKKEIRAKKALLKETLEKIPSRIDETRRMTPEAKDYEGINREIELLQAEVKNLEDKMMDASQAQQANLQALQQKQAKLHNARTEVQNIEFKIKDTFNRQKLERQTTLNAKQNDIDLLKSNIGLAEHKAKAINDRVAINITAINGLRENWIAENDKTISFNENEFCCPTCKREFEADKVAAQKESMQANFNNHKAQTLQNIMADAERLKQQNESIILELQKFNVEITEGKAALAGKQDEYNTLVVQNNQINTNAAEELKKALETNDELRTALDIVSGLEYEINKTYNNNTGTVDTSALRERKSTLLASINNLQRDLNTKEQREKGIARIAQLEEEQSSFSQQLADLEGYEFVIEQFVKTKMDMLVSRINGMFSNVTFKLFENQINGGQVECCETLIDGVPFSDANNAARINAGLDIINTLAAHYNTYAPIFVDNAESVNTLLPVNSQLVRLVVSYDKPMRIERESFTYVTVHERMAVA